MKGVIVLCVVLASLFGSLGASPSRRPGEGESPSLVRSLRSHLLRAGLVSERSESSVHLSTRQQTDVCSNKTQCYPPGINFVPSDLIDCVLPEGVCLCRDCFERGLDGTCLEVSCEDWRYSTQDFDCQDDRPSQLTAFLLSFFLSSTGAANFYIGRDDLGGAQLFLLLLTFAVSYITCYLPCCLGCCMSKDDVKGSIFFIALMVLDVFFTVIILLAIWAWWLADLIIFATNQRDAGNGCMLRENL